MKYLVTKDKNIRFFQQKIELKNFLLKIIAKNKNYFFSLRCNAFAKYNNFSKKNYFKSKIVNRCIFTGRSKGILSKFKISRIVFLNLGRSGNILGLKKFFV